MYIRRKQFYYVSHVIFSIHLYVFLFIALKLADGSWRAFAAVALAALDRLGADTSGADGLRRTPVLGGGRPVGEAHAVAF